MCLCVGICCIYMPVCMQMSGSTSLARGGGGGRQLLMVVPDQARSTQQPGPLAKAARSSSDDHNA